jgi:tetratricopeptide (TPR) repeat protein
VFQQLVEEYDSALVLNNYAYVVGVYMNEPIEGLILAKQAAEKAPRNPSIIDTISVLYERIGNYEKAAEMLDYLLVIDPSNAKAMAKLSILNTEHLQDPERGVVFAERARSLSPRLPEVLDALGWSYYKTGHEDKGKDYLQRSLREGDTMSAYVHLAQVVMKHKEYDKALDYLRMAQELAEDSYSKDSITTLNDDIRSIQVVTPE